MLQAHHPEYECEHDAELIQLDSHISEGGAPAPPPPAKPFGQGAEFTGALEEV